MPKNRAVNYVERKKAERRIDGVIKFREISLKNGQILRDIKYGGTKEEFEKVLKTEFLITLDRQEVVPTDKIQVHLRTDSVAYYILLNA